MKKTICLIFAPALLLTAFSAKAVPILVGSGNDSGHDYLVYEYMSGDDKNWGGAQLFALSQGGYLTTLTDSSENAFVADLVNSTGLGEVWAGGFQNAPGDPDQNWNWVTGESWSYTNWNFGEPNDFYGANSEQYLGINWTNDTWNDEGALGNIKGFVVERVPEPSIVALFGLGLLGLGIARRKMRH